MKLAQIRDFGAGSCSRLPSQSGASVARAAPLELRHAAVAGWTGGVGGEGHESASRAGGSLALAEKLARSRRSAKDRAAGRRARRRFRRGAGALESTPAGDGSRRAGWEERRP